MSTFACPIVPVKLKPHDNADSLSIAEVGGWEVVVKTSEFDNEPFGVYIPLDSVADPDHPLLDFLGGKKVKAIRLRGAVSMGVLLPLSKVRQHYKTKSIAWVEGEDVSKIIQVKKWVNTNPVSTKVESQGSAKNLANKHETTEWPHWIYKYTDIENWNNYSKVITSGEEVHVSLKLHGANAIFAKVNGEYFVCSRKRSLRLTPKTVKIPRFKNRLIKKILKTFKLNNWGWASKDITLPPPTSVWHTVFHQLELTKKLDELSSRYSSPKVAIYGEVVGVQDLKYGLSSGEVDFYAFDIRVEDCPYVEQYLPPLEVEEVCKFLDLKVAPTLYVGPFTTEVLELKEGLDPIGKTHVREGIVIKPLVPRWHSKLHRVCLKKIGNGYLFRSGQKDE